MNVQLETHHEAQGNHFNPDECHLTQVEGAKRFNFIMSLLFWPSFLLLALQFDLEWFVQSPPLLTDMGGPKGWHYIFT
jgi:hypothetical protein